MAALSSEREAKVREIIERSYDYLDKSSASDAKLRNNEISKITPAIQVSQQQIAVPFFAVFSRSKKFTNYINIK